MWACQRWREKKTGDFWTQPRARTGNATRHNQPSSRGDNVDRKRVLGQVLEPRPETRHELDPDCECRKRKIYFGSMVISAAGADQDRLVHVTTGGAAWAVIKVSDCFGRG